MPPHTAARLPHEIADWFTQPFARFLKIEAASGAVLLLATLTALVLSNSTVATPFLAFWTTPLGLHFGRFDLTGSLRHWINDGMMTLFFFVVSLEIKRELILGELRQWRRAALPLAGALGGMLVPALLYVTLTAGRPESHGWGTVVATDTAFLIGCLAVLGRRIPPTLRVFLLSLAIFDDLGAILVVSIGYGGPLNWPALGAAALGFGIIATLTWIGIRSLAVYFLLGSAVWLCFDASGVHPTLMGVILGLMTPTGHWVSDERLRALFARVLSHPRGAHRSGDTAERGDLRRAGIAATEALSPVERLETMLHPWTAFLIMPLFALANAGVALDAIDMRQPVSVAIVAALVLGKPTGVVLMSALATRLGLAARGTGLSWSFLAAGSLLTGIGFTMSLFIAAQAYPPASLEAAKIGIFAASVVSAVAGVLALLWLSARQRSRN
jgi:NhaA family Na+:H+ antiporter